ncbi:cupin domain-containing protein [Archangium lipolyticum]|uniref:cupin domain-containing protein n=1 Tax=Archangium lipolyticum TaxID=2970465 RepID=UPI002149CD26|nr:cupin domain-containing protein [Archangium lipolyticum]
MEQQGLSPEFWNTFVKEYWNKKPVVFKGVLPKDLLTDEDVLEALGNYANAALRDELDSLRPKRPGGFARLYVEGRQIGPMEIGKFMPRGANVPEYIKEVGGSFGGSRVGVILNDVELFSERVGAVNRQLVVPIIERVGIPSRNVEATIFAGDYDVTPFGIHKDDHADVMTLVIAGRKRMLVWPEEYFDQHPERMEQLTLREDAIELFSKDATVLDASPGDLMYWPGSAYHVATSMGGVVATCGLGFWHKTALSEVMSEFVSEFLSAKLGARNKVIKTWQPDVELPSELDAATQELRALLDSGEFREALRKDWKQRVDRLGFLACRKSKD